MLLCHLSYHHAHFAPQVGVNASAEAVLGHLIRQDTAHAFNISEGDVTVTGISQVSQSPTLSLGGSRLSDSVTTRLCAI